MVVNLTKLPIAQQLAVKALLESGKSERHTSKLAKVSRATVRAVNKCKSLDPQLVDRIKLGLASKLYEVADRSLDHITDDKMEKSTSVQLMTTAAIGIDKARLIEGKSTSRTEFVDASDQAINDEIVRLEAELGKWESGQVVNSEEVLTTPAGLSPSQTVEEGGSGGV